MKNLADSRMGCLATLSVLVVRIALLEYSKIHEKFIVCEFEGFQNVVRDACVRAIYRLSDVYIYIIYNII